MEGRLTNPDMPYGMVWYQNRGRYMYNHRRSKLTFRESESIFQFIHIGVTAVRVGTWPLILRSVRLHENCWEFERFIGSCMGNKISLIYNAKWLWNVHVFLVILLKQTHLLCVHCAFWLFSLFWTFYVTTVLPFMRHIAGFFPISRSLEELYRLRLWF